MASAPNRINFVDQRFVNRLYRLHGEELARHNFDFRKGGKYFLYLNSVESHLRRIKHTLETLSLIRVLIAEKHPVSKVKSTSEIPKGEFLRYNIENYFLRLSTYKDQILQFIDCVVQLDTKRGIGLRRQLETKANAKGMTFVIRLINNLDIFFKNVTPTRNKIAHEGYFHSSDIGLIEAGDDLLELQTAGGKLNRADMDKISTTFISENIIEMRRIEDDLGDNLFEILDALYGEFEKNVDEKRAVETNSNIQSSGGLT